MLDERWHSMIIKLNRCHSAGGGPELRPCPRPTCRLATTPIMCECYPCTRAPEGPQVGRIAAASLEQVIFITDSARVLRARVTGAHSRPWRPP
jgi:hypothetical protein